MSGQIVRQRFMRQFVGLSKYSRARAWIIVGSYFLQIIGAAVAGHFVLQSGLTATTVAVAVILSLFMATRMRGLNNIVHECSHFTFSNHRADNVVLGSICASSVLGCYADYRDEHLSHHAHLGDYEHDLDLQGIRDLRLHEPLTAQNILRHFINPFLGRHLPYYLGANLSDRDGRGYLYYKQALIVAGLVFTLWQPVTGMFMVLLSYGFFYPTINYWTDCLDHAGLVSSEDELDSSRNVLAPKWLRVIFFPRNDCFHLVHHLFPNIPARHLEASHKVLSADPIYQEKTNATRPAHVSILGGIESEPKVKLNC
jgi:fatty acid desaturase